MAELELEPWLRSLRHKCTGADCEFCEMRQSNPMELGWDNIDMEKTDVTANFALYTQ